MRILPAWWLPLMVDVCSCSVISECYNKSLQKPNIVPSHIQKNGLYKTSNFGWLTSRFRIIQITNFERYITIQKWIVWNIHFWMTKKHIWNHPKTNCTKRPVLDDLYKHVRNHSDLENMHFQMIYRIIQIWMISSTFQFYRGENIHISTKFGRYFTALTSHPPFEDLCDSQIIHFWSLTLPGGIPPSHFARYLTLQSVNYVIMWILF